MQAIVASSRCRGDLVLADIKPPSPGGREILVQIHATSVNPHDWQYHDWFKRTLYRHRIPLPPLRLGHDFAGIVIEAGKRVKHFKPGDAVYGMSAKPGAFAEIIALDERMVAPKPANTSHEEAAALPMVALTSLQALRIGRIRTGSNVLIIGGSGGVGSVAVQIAKAKGARVTAVCSTRNVDFVRGLGADTVIDYQHADFHQCGERFDLIFDTIGQESTTTCNALLQKGACFISTATSPKNVAATVSSRAMSRLNPDAIRSATLLALPRGNDLQEIRAMAEAGALSVNIDKQFSLAQMRDAFAYSQSGRTRGKLSITVKDH